MENGDEVHEIKPAETYQLDTSEYDSDEEQDKIVDEEYDALVEEAENGFSDEEVKQMTTELKERGIINFLRSYLATGENGELASLRKLLLSFGIIPPQPLRDPSTPNAALLPFTKVALSRILRRRDKLPQYNSLEDALDLLKTAKNIIVLSGAGISTSCGIPDFRSANGLYANLQREGQFDLDDPQQMFDIRYFVEHPEVFYSFAKQIYPSNFTPSPCHRWIKSLEDRGVLLRNYTQNIDTLESLAGVTKVLQCHGSFKTASCLRCKHQVQGQVIEPYIMSSQIPFCGTCRQKRDEEIATLKAAKDARKKSKGKGKAAPWSAGYGDSDSEEEIDEWGDGPPGIIKPDITFFGQALDSEFDECLFKDREAVDLLVIIGTSLKVAPVSEVLTHIPHSVPQIFINLTPVYHVKPDICLLGDADSIVTYLSHRLGFDIPPPEAVVSSPSTTTTPTEPTGKPLQTTLKIPPDQALWRSGADELSHIHVLSSLEEQETVAREKQEDAETASNLAVAKLETDHTQTPNEADGYESDDERPTKRVRADDSI